MLTLEKIEPAQQQKGTWQKGQSGNPRGSRRGYDGPSVSELARTYTRDAVHALVHALRTPSTRVPAAVALLDRGWGKPDVNIHTKNESTVLHLLAAQATEILQVVAPGTIEHQSDELPKE